MSYLHRIALNITKPCLLVYVINTISETIATYTRPLDTLLQSLVILFPQTVFSNELYSLGEITFNRQDGAADEAYKWFSRRQPIHHGRAKPILLSQSRRREPEGCRTPARLDEVACWQSATTIPYTLWSIPAAVPHRGERQRHGRGGQAVACGARNILLINSSPTTYNVSDYRYTYLLSKDSKSQTVVNPLISQQ